MGAKEYLILEAMRRLKNNDKMIKSAPAKTETKTKNKNAQKSESEKSSEDKEEINEDEEECCVLTLTQAPSLSQAETSEPSQKSNNEANYTDYFENCPGVCIIFF